MRRDLIERATGLPFSRRTEHAIALAALALLVLGCFLVLQPFLPALLFAVVLTAATWPTYRRIEEGTGGRRTIAAGLMTALLVAGLLLPIAIVGTGLADNAASVADLVRGIGAGGPLRPPAWLAGLPLFGPPLRDLWLQFAQGGDVLLDALTPYAGVATRTAITIAAGLGGGVLQMTLSLFVAFFLYRDGAWAAARFQVFAEQLAGHRATRLVEVARGTMIGVVYGIIGTALAQGVLAGLGLWASGVPGPLFLGLIACFLSPIPMGPGLVLWPASLWLLSQGSVGWAIALFAWGVGVVGTIDNVLRPVLISRTGGMPIVVVFLGVLGGALAFGVLGVFLGPTLLAVAYTLFRDVTGRPAGRWEAAERAGTSEASAPDDRRPA